MSSHLSTILHDLVNALAITDGMTRSVFNSLKGETQMKTEDQIIRLEKALKALERIKLGVDTLRKEVKKLPSPPSTPGGAV
jgi:hypothetical protein